MRVDWLVCFINDCQQRPVFFFFPPLFEGGLGGIKCQTSKQGEVDAKSKSPPPPFKKGGANAGGLAGVCHQRLSTTTRIFFFPPPF
jgi:hypothetical protein